MTTTGFSTVDFDLWPSFAKCILVLLMIVGACAGSTGGGVKVSRIVLIFKSIHLEMEQLIHPHGIQRIRMDGKVVDSKVLNSIYIFLVTYCLILAFPCCWSVWIILILKPTLRRWPPP